MLPRGASARERSDHGTVLRPVREGGGAGLAGAPFESGSVVAWPRTAFGTYAPRAQPAAADPLQLLFADSNVYVALLRAATLEEAESVATSLMRLFWSRGEDIDLARYALLMELLATSANLICLSGIPRRRSVQLR